LGQGFFFPYDMASSSNASIFFRLVPLMLLVPLVLLVLLVLLLLQPLLRLRRLLLPP
jgi:hypothetical protein